MKNRFGFDIPDEIEQDIEASKQKWLQKGPPNIEIIDEDEIYLLDDGGLRVKRICGKQKAGYPDGYVCVNPAGWGTLHPGISRCKYHEPKGNTVTHVSFWKRLRKKYHIVPNVSEALDLAEELTDNELASVDLEIQMLYSLLIDHMQGNAEWKKGDSKFALLILDKIVKAKETKSKIEKALAVDPRVITAFVDQIFSQIVKFAEREVARKIMESILSEVVVPLAAQNEYPYEKAKYLEVKAEKKIMAKGEKNED